jgi:hypothetical protein
MAWWALSRLQPIIGSRVANHVFDVGQARRDIRTYEATELLKKP